MRTVVKQITPPIVLSALRSARGALKPQQDYDRSGNSQQLDVYWTPEMEAILQTWGRGNAWDEIQGLFAGRTGKALDIACGTGINMLDIAKNPGLDVWGLDISDRLLAAAERNGIAKNRLVQGDATKLPFTDGQFDFSYSIGSLEHFTDTGTDALISESARVTRNTAFHMIPVAAAADEGWIKTNQEYWNMGLDWWLPKFQKCFKRVATMRSAWQDGNRSIGMWFVCSHERV